MDEPFAARVVDADLDLSRRIDHSPRPHDRVGVLLRLAKLASVVPIVGYVASALVCAAFFMRSQLRLRQLSIGSNIAFLAYASVGHLYPILVLHAILLPLNIWRLSEIVQTRRAIAAAIARTDLSLEWLTHHMRRMTLAAGESLFRQGDPADLVYCIMDGTLGLDETGIILGPGSLIGEIGVFSPAHTRTQSATALRDASLLVISRDELLVLYRRQPAFGLYLIQLITKRLLESEALRESAHAHEAHPARLPRESGVA